MVVARNSDLYLINDRNRLYRFDRNLKIKGKLIGQLSFNENYFGGVLILSYDKKRIVWRRRSTKIAILNCKTFSVIRSINIQIESSPKLIFRSIYLLIIVSDDYCLYWLKRGTSILNFLDLVSLDYDRINEIGALNPDLMETEKFFTSFVIVSKHRDFEEKPKKMDMSPSFRALNRVKNKRFLYI